MIFKIDSSITNSIWVICIYFHTIFVHSNRNTRSIFTIQSCALGISFMKTILSTIFELIFPHCSAILRICFLLIAWFHIIVNINIFSRAEDSQLMGRELLEQFLTRLFPNNGFHRITQWMPVVFVSVISIEFKAWSC